MHPVLIPDPLYDEAERAAAAGGLSVEAYVQEALELHLKEEAPVQLLAGQVAIIAKAEADIDAGKFFTADQIRTYFNQKISAWTQSNPA